MICPACGASGADDGAICLSCGRVLDESGRLPIGYVLAGRYELRRFLGEGGMGTVYEGYDRKLEERLALKLLKADFAHSPEMERRFRHEIRLARRIRHPNVCAIHEYGEAGPLRYISMELIEGSDLKQRLREQGAIAPAQAFRIAIQIAQGLDCIHRTGVVHRDLKASNVMLDGNGDVRLMDFGIAKQLGAEATLGAVGATAVGSIIGTPEYMSPEQGRGDSIDYRSDIYSLGIVVYEIFTGDVPFHGDTPIATLFKAMQDPVDLEGPRARGIPTALRPVLLKALAKSAAERYASAEEMAAALALARDATLGPNAASGPATSVVLKTAAIDAQATRPAPGSSTPAPLAAEPPETALTPRPREMAEAETELTPRLAPPPLADRVPPIHRTPPGAARIPGRTPSPISPRASQPATSPRPSAPAAPPSAARPSAAARAAAQQAEPPTGFRAVLPLLLAGVGFGLIVVGGAAAIHFWPRPLPPTTSAVTVTGQPAPSAVPRIASPSSPAAERTASATAAPPASFQAAPRSVSPTPRPLSPTPPPLSPTPPPVASVPQTPQTLPPRTTPTTLVRLPVVTLSAAPSAVATPSPAPATLAPDPGKLQLYVRPWAQVTVDGQLVGTTPMRPISLAPGNHVVLLKHPEFAPLTRQLAIESGRTNRLEVDFSRDGVKIQ